MYVSDRKEVTQGQKFGSISKISAVSIIVGMVIGPGIFKTPSIVASSSGSEINILLLWFAGGVISLIGALCYAELTSTYPHAGGEYHYLGRSLGKRTAFLFAWGRLAIIQTGSIAMLSFIIGDYAAEAFSFGPLSSSFYAGITVVLLTLVNLKGLKPSSKLQTVLIGAIMLGLGIVITIGMIWGNSYGIQNKIVTTDLVIGHAMIFVLLTYGGWNEAAYLSAEVGKKPIDTAKVLFYSIGIITLIYLIINFSFINGLGMSGLSGSQAVAADLVSGVFGENGVKFISLLIAVAALSTVNAVMITGARTNYAMGKDFKTFKFLSKWDEHGPANAYLIQAGIALLLIIIGSFTRSGFVTMVEFTSPVFWFFFLLVGLSVILLRIKEPKRHRPFKVPLYPVVPVLFCAAALFMLHSSLMYTGVGAIIGVVVLICGIPFLFLKNNRITKEDHK